MNNDMPRVVIPSDPKKLQQQIEALKYLLEHDTREKDKAMHLQALADLEAALEKLKAAK